MGRDPVDRRQDRLHHGDTAALGSAEREGLIKLLKGQFTGRSPALAGDLGI